MSEHQALRIGVVGLGQCGGNFAAEFANRGYPALAVNTSQTDLRSVGLDDEQRLYVGIEGLNGTGGAMAVGAESLAARGPEIVSAVAGWPEVEAVLAVGGLGGGTGANLAQVVELLSTGDCPVIAMAVLPASSESHTAKVNALQGINALLDVDFEALIVVDNQKVYAAFSNAGLDQFLHEGNRAVVSAFDELNGLSGQGDLSSIRSFDPPQLRHTLLSGGVVVFGSRVIADALTPESLLDAVRFTVADHEYLGSGYKLPDAVVVSAVMISNADVLADTPATVFEDFSAQLKNETGGADLHAGIYGGDVKSTRVHVMVGGLPLPSRTQELLDEAAQEAERFSTKRAPRKKLQKLDLSVLAALTSGRLAPPSTGGKGMAKISPKPSVGKESEEPTPLVDLGFDDDESPLVEEELIHDGMISDDMVTDDMTADDMTAVDEDELK